MKNKINLATKSAGYLTLVSFVFYDSLVIGKTEVY